MTHHLVANRVYVVGRVEGSELMRQQVSRAQEDESSDANKMVTVRVQHHGRHLALLVARDEHATLHAQCCQLVVFLVL